MDTLKFKLDIDELLEQYDQGGFKSFASFKRIWLARKFSFIFDARPSNANLPLFMQSLYTHCIGHTDTSYSLSHRLGGLYCLYCLYEIQPFKPVFKIYLSIGELRRLKLLVADAKKDGTEVIVSLLSRMLTNNAFLFGFVDMSSYSKTERLKELVNVQNASLRMMHEKLMANSDIERYLHMDMGVELDLASLKKVERDYVAAKELAVGEATMVTDAGDVKHIAENTTLVSDQIEKITEDWKLQKELFYQQTGSHNQLSITGGNDGQVIGNGGMELVPVPPNESDMAEFERSQGAGFMELLTSGGERPGSVTETDDCLAEIEALLGREDEEEDDYVYELEKTSI